MLKKPIVKTERMLTMQEAMEYLSDSGIPCKSRATFYRRLKDFDIPYVITNPSGKHKVRRFKKDDLIKAIESQGLTP